MSDLSKGVLLGHHWAGPVRMIPHQVLEDSQVRRLDTCQDRYPELLFVNSRIIGCQRPRRESMAQCSYPLLESRLGGSVQRIAEQ
ncbi:hypothetical protein KBX71_22660 [Micromonospora sp. D93]|uniref:hypothetical protein n=1 Tax=Micromonospora sp. D93 TaxID=2824886 RepID=UPI001B375C5B|nr:hypothetical protein [Micromonospora sp. D93]MBQ1020658.1 hypothetical protein [Micromonospora sp. D93]